MSEIKQGEFSIQKNEWGYTIFAEEGIILSDAPYERLKTDPYYKETFVESLEEWKRNTNEGDAATLQEWIDDIEELGE